MWNVSIQTPVKIHFRGVIWRILDACHNKFGKVWKTGIFHKTFVHFNKFPKLIRVTITIVQCEMWKFKIGWSIFVQCPTFQNGDVQQQICTLLRMWGSVRVTFWTRVSMVCTVWTFSVGHMSHEIWYYGLWLGIRTDNSGLYSGLFYIKLRLRKDIVCDAKTQE